MKSTYKKPTAKVAPARKGEKDVEKGLSASPNPKGGKEKEAGKEVNDNDSKEVKEENKEVIKAKIEDKDKLKYDPEDDIWTLDRIDASPGRKYARSLVNAFYSVMLIATGLGLYPLRVVRRKDGSYKSSFSWGSVPAILFLFASSIVVLVTLWIIFSVACIAVDFPDHPDIEDGKTGDILRSEELYVYKRNIVFLVVLLCSCIHLSICMIAVFNRRDYIVKQFLYWTEVVELLQLDVGKHVGMRVWRQLIALLIFTGLLCFIYAMNISPGLAGSGSTFYLLVARLTDPETLWHTHIPVTKHLFAVYTAYVIFAGYLYIFWFFYNCRILINILRIWNNRFQYCLHKQIFEFASKSRARELQAAAQSASRTSRGHLFQDHLVIFNLIEGVNGIFEIVMESFYLNTMIMLVFEAYGFVHTLFYYEYVECGKRQRDFIPILLFLCFQIYTYFTVTLEASGVADEARHVLDIVRRKGMMTSKMDNELWFMMSMRLSFGGHADMGIVGAGFFQISKAFLLVTISAMTSLFIIYYQFEVPYAQTEEADANYDKLDTEGMLDHLEGVGGTDC